VTLFIPCTLVNPLNGSHGHWSKRARSARTQREKAQMYLLQALGTERPNPHTLKRITFTAYTYNAFDGDGLQASLKNIRDALKDMRIVDDDRASLGHQFVYEQQISRGKNAKRGVQITVETLK